MSVKERLIDYIKFKRISARQFSLSIGVSAGYVNSIDKSIHPDKISRIAVQYPELNIEWLLTGEGEMLKNPTQEAGQSQPLPSELSGDRFDRMMNIMEMQAKQLQTQSEQIKSQSERIDALIEQNNKLLKELEKQDAEEGYRSHEASARS